MENQLIHTFSSWFFLNLCLHSYRNGNSVSSTNGVEPPGQLNERNDLQKEVLFALFNAPERSEELVRRTTNAVKRSASSWRVVDGPSMDLVDHKKTVTYLQRDNEDGMYSSMFSGNLMPQLS